MTGQRHNPLRRRAKGGAAGTNHRDALGVIVRRLRKERGWTLAEAGRRCGLSISTLSKVENSLLSLTFDNLLKLAKGFDLAVGDLFAPGGIVAARETTALTRRGGGKVHETANYAHEYVCTDLPHRRMIPLVSRIKARTIEDFGSLIRHAGEEYIHVLEGTVDIVIEGKEPQRLRAGDSFYFNSAVGHAILAVGAGDGLILSVLWPGDRPAPPADGPVQARRPRKTG